MRFLRKSLTGLFLLSLTLGLLVWAGAMVRDAVQDRLSEEPPQRRASEQVFAVNVVTALPGTEVPVLTAFGEVQSRRTLELRAATPGTVMELAPEFVEGGRVSEGQLLARIDPAEAQAELDRAESDLLDAQAEQREADRALVIAQDELSAAREQVRLQEQALQRQRDLVDRGVGATANVESAELAVSSAGQAVLTRRQAVAEAEARIDQAVTDLKRAEVALSEAERRLADTKIRAAFSGTLSDVTVVTGGLVSANEQLAQLVDLDALEVAFRVSTAQYTRLLDNEGDLRSAPVTVTLDTFGLDLAATGVLDREGAAVGEGQTGRRLFADLDNARGFKPGDFVTVTIQEAPIDNIARLPATAINAANEVLVVDEDERLLPVQVELVRRQGDDILVRAEGLDGQRVVAQRTPLLGAGIKVRPASTRSDRDRQETSGDATLLELTEERRARLVAFVEASDAMPEEARTRILAQLGQSRVPAQVVQSIESRMGG